LQHILRRAGGEKTALGENGDAIGEAGSGVEIVQHGDGGEAAAGGRGAQVVQHMQLVGEVQGAGGFIQQQQRGVGGEDLGEKHKLALAAAEFADATLREIGDAEFGKAGGGGVHIQTGGAEGERADAAEQDDFVGGERGASMIVLRQVGDGGRAADAA